MSADQCGEFRLIAAREAGHVAVLHQVRAVPVVAGVRDREPDLDEPRRPRERAPRRVERQLPRFRDLFEQCERRAFDASRVLEIDAPALLPRADRSVAGVVVRAAAGEVVEHAFAHRAFRDVHALEVEALEHRLHDREARADHAGAIGREALELELRRVPRRDEFLLQPFQPLARDAAVRPTVGAEHLFDREDRARRTDARFPAEAPVAAADRGELETRGDLRAFQPLAIERAVREELGRVRDAAHRERVHRERLEAVAEDALGRAAADVDDEAPFVLVRERVRDSEEDQARLLATRHDFDRVTERLLRAFTELRGVAGDAQRVGADGAHPRRREFAQPLAETLQCGERARFGLLADLALRPEAFGERDAFAQPVEHEQLPVRELRDQQVKTVRPEVDGGERRFVLREGHVEVPSSILLEPRADNREVLDHAALRLRLSALSASLRRARLRLRGSPLPAVPFDEDRAPALDVRRARRRRGAGV